MHACTGSRGCTWSASVLAHMERCPATLERIVAKCRMASEALVPQDVKFRTGDFPPLLPADPFFKLECTTFDVSTETPHEVGNRLVMEIDKAAAITRYNRHKYVIVAVSAEQNLACEFKVRVYNLGGYHYAVEFQRRAGDAVLFNYVFQRVRARFGKLHTYMPDPCDPPPFLLDETFCWSDAAAFGVKRELSLEYTKGPREWKLARTIHEPCVKSLSLC